MVDVFRLTMPTDHAVTVKKIGKVEEDDLGRRLAAVKGRRRRTSGKRVQREVDLEVDIGVRCWNKLKRSWQKGTKPPKREQGFNGTDLRDVCTESAISAICAEHDYVIHKDFMKVKQIIL
ncbi:26S proteasome regulatory subunit S10B [Artemisia annua]|uniref:26S proteasome regulatory subunit S10B n=1 Tax=Artemisia annua TaxID=35608 RepID=A0A2U1P2U2_ARTAN|nr:26S proteasome regulatory subunit S10B [Artemisia annua]